MENEKEMDPSGLAAARRVAHWHIGDSEFADMILEAYFDPEGATDGLDKEQAWTG